MRPDIHIHRPPRPPGNTDHHLVLEYILMDRVSRASAHGRHGAPEGQVALFAEDAERPAAAPVEDGVHDDVLRADTDVFEWRVSVE